MNNAGSHIRHLVAQIIRLPVPWHIMRYSILLATPLVAVTIGIKGIKLFSAKIPPNISIFESAVVRLQEFFTTSLFPLCVLAVVAYLLWKRIFGAGRNLWFALLIVLLFSVAIVFKYIITGEWYLYSSTVFYNSTRELIVLYSVFRWDVVFLAAFIAICAISLHRWSNGVEFKRVRALIVSLELMIVLVAGLEIGHYLKTGDMGTGQILIYLITRFTDLWFIILGELDWVVVTAIVAPVLAVLPVFLIRKPADGATLGATSSESQCQIGWLLWPVLLAFTIPPERIVSLHYQRFSHNTYIMIARDLLAIPFDTYVSGTLDDELLFDVNHMEIAPTERTKKSNVVLIILESARAKATTVYRPGLNTTPFLKDFAQHAVVVEQMYVVVPRTLAGWVSVLQGVYPAANNVTERWARKVENNGDEYPSLPKLLRQYGYSSAFFTPTHLNIDIDRQVISNIGFDHVVSKHNYASGQFEIVNYFGWEDRIMLQPIFSWVESQKQNNHPMLLTVMTNVGHYDYKVPTHWPKIQFNGALGDQHNDYLNSMSYIDSFLRELISGLDSRGVLEESIVVIVGDHGESFGEHGAKQHNGVIYEEALHVPAIIYSSADNRGGTRLGGVWQLTDIFPTIIDALGFDLKNARLPGTSILGPPLDNRRIYFMGSFDQTHLAMRQGDLKYIYHFRRRPMEVYNLNADREENHDLRESVDDDAIGQIERDMLRWRESVKHALLEN